MPSANSGTIATMGSEVKKKRGRPRKHPILAFEYVSDLGLEEKAATTFDKAIFTPLEEVKKKLQARNKMPKKRKRTVTEGIATIPLLTSTDVAGVSSKTQTHSRFTVKELVDIIKSGRTANLLEFRYMGLHLSFMGPVAMPNLPKKASPKTSSQQSLDQSSPSMIQGMNQVADDALQEDLEHMMLYNPHQAEQVMADRIAKVANLDEAEIG